MAVRRTIKKQLGQLLVEAGIINQQQLDMALNIQRGKGGFIGEILVDLKFVVEEDIAQVLTMQYGFPYLPLDNYEIEPEIINIIPARVMRQYMLLPIDKIGDTLSITMSNPLNEQAIEDVELLSNCHVQTFVSTSSDIRRAIAKYCKDKT